MIETQQQGQIWSPLCLLSALTSMWPRSDIATCDSAIRFSLDVRGSLVQCFSSPKHCNDSAYIHPPSSHVPCQLGHVCPIPSKKPHTSSLVSWYVLIVPEGNSKYFHVLLTNQGLGQEKGWPEARQKEQEAKEAAAKEGEEALAKESRARSEDDQRQSS